MSVIRVRRVLEETIPLIVFFSTIELISGGFLSSMTKDLEMLPGLLIMIPPLLGLRGSIGSALGARLGSALHMGLIRPDKITNDLKTNIYASLLMSATMSVVLAFMSWFACSVTSVACIPLYTFLLISVIAGFSSGVILTFIAVFVSIYGFRKGIDPDDVTTPTLGTIGDIVTVICLFVVVRLVIGV
jgi:mgtE-like transporter